MSTPDPANSPIRFLQRLLARKGSKRDAVWMDPIDVPAPQWTTPAMRELMNSPYVADTLMQFFPKSNVRSVKYRDPFSVLGFVEHSDPLTANITEGNENLDNRYFGTGLLLPKGREALAKAYHNFDLYLNTGEGVLQHELAHTLDLGKMDPDLVRTVVSRQQEHADFLKQWWEKARFVSGKGIFSDPKLRPLSYTDEDAAQNPREYFANTFTQGMTVLRRASEAYKLGGSDLAKLVIEREAFLPGAEDVVKWALAHPVMQENPLRELYGIETDWVKWTNPDLSPDQVREVARQRSKKGKSKK